MVLPLILLSVGHGAWTKQANLDTNVKSPQSGAQQVLGGTPVQVPAPRIISAGARPEFEEAVYAVQNALSKADNEEAVKAGALLPKAHFKLGWDENSIPENMRADIDQMRDLVIAAWKHVNNVVIDVVPSGDLNIKFGKGLPKDSDGLPVASQVEFGTNPRLNVTIDLERGAPVQSIIPTDSYMEIGHAIGAYLGVADDALAGNCMYRNNHPALRVFGPSQNNFYVVSNNLKMTDELLNDIATHKKVDMVGSPQMELTIPNTAVGKVRQGLKIPLDFKIKNNGTSPLAYDLTPDCNCFTKPPPGSVPPGKEVMVRTIMNTSVYIGPVDKLLVLYTNDPKDPVHQIPVSFRSAPSCRLYRPQGDSVLLPAPNNMIDILMTIPSDSNVVPEQYEWNGMSGTVSMSKWSGSVADADLGEGVEPRKGYIFHLKVGKDQIPGRTTGTLTVTTNDDENPQMRFTIFAQKGILAFPSDLEYGPVSTVSRSSFQISQPTKPFKVTGVETGTKLIKASMYPLSPSSYRLDVIFDPTNAPKGDFTSYVKVLTDDPTQKAILVSVRGTVQ